MIIKKNGNKKTAKMIKTIMCGVCSFAIYKLAGQIVPWWCSAYTKLDVWEVTTDVQIINLNCMLIIKTLCVKFTS